MVKFDATTLISSIRGMPPDAYERARRSLMLEEDERLLVLMCRRAAALAVAQLFERATLNAQLTRARLPENKK